MKNQNEKNLVSTIANIISSIVLVFAILICFLVIVSMKSSSGVANIFGYAVLSVQSDSMEPVFKEDDLIVIRVTKPTERFKDGDIVSFFAYDSSGLRFINTHRIVEVNHGETRDRYVTKGDNAAAKDRKGLYSNNIIGEYTGKKISRLGAVVDFINSPTGILLCVVIPSAIIIIAQAVSYANSAQKRKKQMLLEAEERARQERIQLVSDVVAAQRGAAGGTYIPPVQLDPNVPIDDADKQRVIQEYLQQQAQEEAKKQAIIEEYLQKQKEAEQAAKEEAEAAKIKAIIAEFLAQQQKAGEGESESSEKKDSAEPPQSPSGPEDSEG
ncbi:MAG: signal peptidase I [Clostridia bacterium]|nr:signal peptidase I [Clostridia bacterium]